MENAHVSALIAKHAGIEERLSNESRRPSPDTALVNRLKKMKLKIKEELAHI